MNSAIYETVSISTDSNNNIIAAVVNAYQGSPTDPATPATAYDLIAQGSNQVTAAGITINYSQLAALIYQASVNQFTSPIN